MTITSDDWLPGSEVRVFLESTPRLIGTVTADANGSFSTQVAIPDDVEPGQHTIRLVGTDSDGAPREDAIPFTVLAAADGVAAPAPAAGPAPGGLARTGTNLLTNGFALSLVLIMAGGVLIATSRRRRRLAGLAGMAAAEPQE